MHHRLDITTCLNEATLSVSQEAQGQGAQPAGRQEKEEEGRVWRRRFRARKGPGERRGVCQAEASPQVQGKSGVRRVSYVVARTSDTRHPLNDCLTAHAPFHYTHTHKGYHQCARIASVTL